MECFSRKCSTECVLEEYQRLKARASEGCLLNAGLEHSMSNLVFGIRNISFLE